MAVLIGLYTECIDEWELVVHAFTMLYEALLNWFLLKAS